jgi:hypothetical protein
LNKDERREVIELILKKVGWVFCQFL